MKIFIVKAHNMINNCTFTETVTAVDEVDALNIAKLNVEEGTRDLRTEENDTWNPEFITYKLA